MAYDVGIVGGGISGCSTALRLADKGCNVILWEHGTIGCEGSGRNGGGTRQSQRDPAELDLAMLSQGIWSEMARSVGSALECQRGGFLKVVLEQAEMTHMSLEAARQCRGGLEVYILTRRETLEIAPFIEGDFLGSAFCPLDGHVNPIMAMRAIGLAALRAGAVIREKCRVTGLERNNSRWRVKTSEGEFSCSVLVIAAGPWSVHLAAMAGVTLPIEERISQIAVTEPVGPFMSQFISSTGSLGYCRQAKSGNVHLGYPSQPFKGSDHQVTVDGFRELGRGMPSLIPSLNRLCMIRAWAGFTDWTPDAIPIIGPVSSVPGLMICAGFSAHGFQLGPGVGVVLSELITGETPTVCVKHLALDRFQ